MPEIKLLDKVYIMTPEGPVKCVLTNVFKITPPAWLEGKSTAQYYFTSLSNSNAKFVLFNTLEDVRPIRQVKAKIE